MEGWAWWAGGAFGEGVDSGGRQGVVEEERCGKGGRNKAPVCCRCSVCLVRNEGTIGAADLDAGVLAFWGALRVTGLACPMAFLE